MRTRRDLLASVVVEGKTAAEGGVGRRGAVSHHCRRGYCWEGWAAAGEHHLKRSAARERNQCFYFKQMTTEDIHS